MEAVSLLVIAQFLVAGACVTLGLGYLFIWVQRSQKKAYFSIRRFRFSMDVQLSERTSGFFQLGANNLNYLSGNAVSVDLLDAYAEYKVSDAFS